MATRRERVVLELEDNFTSVMARAAAATAVLKREMDSLDGKGSSVGRDLDNADRSVTRLSGDIEKSGPAIDRYSGRLQTMAQAALALGPGLIPVGAAVTGLGAALAAPISTAAGGLTIYGLLTGQAVKQTEQAKKQIDDLGKKVAAARTAVANANAAASTSQANSNAAAQRSAAMSMQSAEQSAQKSILSARQALATATTASARAAAQQRIDTAQQSLAQRRQQIQQSLANSQASAAASASSSQATAQRNLNDVLDQYHTALNALSPAQKRFIDAQDSLKRAFQDFIQKTGPELLGPLTAGMHDLNGVLPEVEPLIRDVGHALTILLNDFDHSIQSGSLRSFLDLMERMSGPSIVSLGNDLGNIGSGLSGLIEASAPLSHGVLDSLERMTGDFAHFGQNAGTNGFQDFLDYVREQGPHVLQLLGDTAGAFAAIVRDAAPIGGLVVQGLDDFAKVLHAIADSPVGPSLFTAAAGLVAVNRALSVAEGFKSSTVLQFLSGKETFHGLGRLQLGLAGLGTAIATFGQQSGEAGGGLTAFGAALTGASIGSAFGPWGTAIGGASGALVGLVAQLHNSDHVIGKSKPIVTDYAATFDRLTGAITRATRAQVFNDLQKSGAVKAAQELGVSAKTLTDAALGNEAAQKRVNAALQQARHDVASLTEAQRKNFSNKTAYMDYKNQIDQLEGSYNLVKGSVDQTSAAIRRQQQDARDARGALIDYVQVFKGFPKQAVTEIKTEGIPDSRQAIIDLIQRYKLTPKEIATLVRISGTGPAKQAIQSVADELKRLHDLTVNLTVIRNTGRGQSRTSNSAAGNIFGSVRAYAAGDVANGHLPELAGPGATRIWREPETKGEAYIPLANDWRRPRAVDIWERTGQALGVQFARFAAGGMTRTVTVSPQVAGGVGIDYDRLAGAMLNARAMYGDVHVYGDGSFRREMLADKQRASLGVLG